MEKIKKIVYNLYLLYKNIINIDYKFKHLKQSILYEIEMRKLFDITNNSIVSGVNRNKYCDEDIVVSLTTYGRRFLCVHTTIESIMQQTMRPNRIILWLDKSFEDRALPLTLKMQQKRGLEIKYCEDIKSYKKLIPTLKICSNDIIITCDDDVIYSPDMIENLTREYLLNPSEKIVYANVCHKITIDKRGFPNQYSKWMHNISDTEASAFVFPVGVGGVLYPPHSLDMEVINEKQFMRLSPFGDDIWFKFMSLKKGYRCKKVQSRTIDGIDFLENIEVRDCGLAQINNIQNKNDEQVNNVIREYNLKFYV